MYDSYGWQMSICRAQDTLGSQSTTICLNTLRYRQNGRYFADVIFKCIFLNANASISLKISLKFVPKGSIDNIPALVPKMAWRRSGDKPLSEPMMISLPTHICVTRPQWVNSRAFAKRGGNFKALFSNTLQGMISCIIPVELLWSIYRRMTLINIGSGNGLVPTGSKPLP